MNFVNRWTYNSSTGWLGQVAIKYLDDTKQGRPGGIQSERDKFTTNKYGFEINTKRTELVGNWDINLLVSLTRVLAFNSMPCSMTATAILDLPRMVPGNSRCMRT